MKMTKLRDTKSDYYEDNTEDDNTTRVLKKQITVTSATGKTVTGRVLNWHWVHGPCSGTSLRDWFIICTKPYPYNRDRRTSLGLKI